MNLEANQPIPNIPNHNGPRVIILGAGFAGLKLARKLRNSRYQVILLDKNNYHQFQPLFYQVATSGLEPSAISFPLRKLFHKAENVVFRMATITAVDQESKRIFTHVGYIEYDLLVLAMGADTNYFGIKNIEKYSNPMKSVSEALYIRNRIIQNYETAINTADIALRKPMMNVVIVGGGPTGVELAGAVAELRNNVFPKDYPELNFRNMKVVLIEAGPTLLPSMSEKAKSKSQEYLERLGVEVLVNTQVIDYNGKVVTLKDGTQIATHSVLWAAGIRANQIEGIPEEQIHPTGRYRVDQYNRLPGSENLFALGDICIMPSDEYPNGHPQVAQVALQQAANLSKNLLGTKPWKPFSYKDLGSMATVGRTLAVADLPFVRYQGFLAWITWLFVHLMAILGVKNKLFIFLDWAWNYLSFDPSLRLLIRPVEKKARDEDRC